MKYVNRMFKIVVCWSIIIWWLLGIALTQNSRQTFGSIVCPPYALYLVVEHVAKLTHFI